jgi:hypothetical protein
MGGGDWLRRRRRWWGISNPGSTSECDSGEVCRNLSGDGNQCRKICMSQAECPAGENCEGIANTTLKSRKPAPTPTPAGTSTGKKSSD